jgi:hypothetical protein
LLSTSSSLNEPVPKEDPAPETPDWIVARDGLRTVLDDFGTSEANDIPPFFDLVDCADDAESPLPFLKADTGDAVAALASATSCAKLVDVPLAASAE